MAPPTSARRGLAALGSALLRMMGMVGPPCGGLGPFPHRGTQGASPKAAKTAHFRSGNRRPETFFLCSRTFFAKNPKTVLLARESRVDVASHYTPRMSPDRPTITPHDRVQAPRNAAGPGSVVGGRPSIEARTNGAAGAGSTSAGGRTGSVDLRKGIAEPGSVIEGGGSGIKAAGSAIKGKRSGIKGAGSGTAGTGKGIKAGRSGIDVEKYRTPARAFLTDSCRKQVLPD